MAAVNDFRKAPLSLARIDSCGRDVGRRSYWRLYAIENLLRIIIHSVLTAEIAPGWWTVSIDPTLRGAVEGFKGLYARKPQHSKPGKHEIYYTFLSDLNRIIAAHRHLFILHIPDIDQWVTRIEMIRLPRNIVGHMNWPHAADRELIDDFYDDLQGLVKRLGRSGSGVPLLIP